MSSAARRSVYINSDVNGRGFFGAGGSHSLQGFINEVAKDVPDPETGISVWKRASSPRSEARRPHRSTLASGGDLRIEALGSGSDFTPFLQHLAIATLNIGFGGEDGNGIYHSIYDNFEHFTRLNDTEFVYGARWLRRRASRCFASPTRSSCRSNSAR